MTASHTALPSPGSRIHRKLARLSYPVDIISEETVSILEEAANKLKKPSKRPPRRNWSHATLLPTLKKRKEKEAKGISS